MGLIRLARGGVRAGSCAFPASQGLLGHPCECSQLLAQHSKTNALPVPSSPRFIKGPWRCRGASFFEKNRPSVWLFFFSKAGWPRKTQWFWHLCFPQFSSILIPNLFRAFKKRAGALFRSFGSRGPLLRPRRKTQPTVVIGVRLATLFGQSGPGTREGCTFSKSFFLVVV